MQKIRKGDNVIVIAGKEKGKSGEVVAVVKKEGKVTKVVVKDINKVKRHQKPVPQFNIPGGINEFEKPIDVSNVMLSVDGKTSRVGIKVDGTKKVRMHKKLDKKI